MSAFASRDANGQVQIPPECQQGYFESAFDHRNSRPDGSNYRYVVSAAQWAAADKDPGWPGGRVRAMHLTLLPSPLLTQGPTNTAVVLVWDGSEVSNPTGKQFWSIVRPELPDSDFDKFWNFELSGLVFQGRGSDLGCAGHATVARGTSQTQAGELFVVAGTSQVFDPQTGKVFIKGTDFAYLFDPSGNPGAGNPPGSNLWKTQAVMAKERWYPSVTHVRGGTPIGERLLVTGGRDEAVTPGDADHYEAFDPHDPILNNRWKTWGSQANRLFRGPSHLAGVHYLHLYPRLHLLSNGELFRSGMMPHGAVVRHDDGPQAGDAVWVKRGQTGPQRWYGASILFPNIDLRHTNAVMILGGLDPGSNAYLSSAQICKASTSNTTGDFDSNPQGYGWSTLSAMAYAREYPSAVILPDASVVVFGGVSGKDANGNEVYVLQAERYQAGGWTPLASGVSPRDDHSTAVLLPSGKVLVAGGDHRWSGPNPGSGSSGPCDYEIYVPWYLAGCDARPTWTSLPPQQLSYATQYSAGFSLAAGAALGRVVLMRPGSTSHHSDFDQRYVQLDHEVVIDPGTGAQTVFFTTPPGPPGTGSLPNDSNAAPRGWYMLFLVTTAGAPSVAHWVNLQ